MSLIYEKDSRRILFIHVPKTGGSSIRKMLENDGWIKSPMSLNSWKLSVFDTEQLSIDNENLKHQTTNFWKTWGNFDFVFALTRNPYDRIVSAALWPPAGVPTDDNSISLWMIQKLNWVINNSKNELTKKIIKNRNIHVCPMNYFIDDSVRIYRFEEGLKSIVLDLHAKGILSKVPDEIVHKNKKKADITYSWENHPDIIELVNKAYMKDFELYSYDVKTLEEDVTLEKNEKRSESSKRLLDDLEFTSLNFNSRNETLTGVDSSLKYLIKIQVVKNNNKLNDIKKEFKILKDLNKKGCKTCPVVYEAGKISRDNIILKVQERDIARIPDDDSYHYLIEDFLKESKKYTLADIVLTMIEQKKLGVYQGDVKPDNIRFDEESGVCYFIDYDQAVTLSDELKKSSNEKFFKYCNDYDSERYGFGDWLRHFSKYSEWDLDDLFIDDSFNLSNTTIFQKQMTTNSKSGIYHTIKSPDIFADGSRTILQRARLLDKVKFDKREKILDVGCNAGLLSLYLHEKECDVTGVDNDPHIVIAAKIISNIFERDIKYDHMDLDLIDSLDNFDTIMLFSVFHHTKNIRENAIKVSSACKRIIIETRLNESGKQPVNNSWINTTNWSFNSLDHLVQFLESIFHGFKLSRNLGFADKNRHVLELIKIDKGADQ